MKLKWIKRDWLEINVQFIDAWAKKERKKGKEIKYFENET